MEVDFAILVVIGGGVPVRLGYDDTVGQNGQGVLDDWHLQGITWRQVPQHAYKDTNKPKRRTIALVLSCESFQSKKVAKEFHESIDSGPSDNLKEKKVFFSFFTFENKNIF